MRQHLSLEELLDLEDGISLPGAQEHLASCSYCASEQAALRSRKARLRNLSELRPPTDQWPAIERALRANRMRRQLTWGALAMAAALAALVVGFSLLRRQAVPPPVAVAEKPTAAAPAADNSEVAQLMKQSETLEGTMHRLPEPKTLSIGAAATLVDLEDRLAFIDRCIEQLRRGSGSPEELTALYKTRLEILQDLISRRKPPVALVSL